MNSWQCFTARRVCSVKSGKICFLNYEANYSFEVKEAAYISKIVCNLQNYFVSIFRMRLKFFAVIIPMLLFAHASSSKIPLVIGGVFDIDTKPGEENSASMIPIVRMAIDHVNSCPKTLANYELQMEVKDVKVSKFSSIESNYLK